MALGNGFVRIEASNNTFSDWLNKTNEMSDLFRDDVVTANADGANTDGNARLNGEFVANTLIAYDALRGGDLSVGLGTDSANLSVVSNTIFTTNCDLVTIEANLQVDTDSLFFGNVQAQSTVQFANNDSAVEFKGANQDFIWLSTNTHATIRTSSAGSLELNADVAANGDNESSVQLKVDSVNVASFHEGGNIAFYSADGTTEKIKWDAANQVLGVNTASPQTDIALDVAGNTHTTDLNVANQTTSGNVVVNNELRGNNTLTVTTNAQFTDAQVVVDNDLFVLGDAQVTSNLTVNTDSTFVGDIEVQADSLFIGNVEAQSTIEFTKGGSTLEFAGANQDFIWDATDTRSTIRTNANGSLIIDADKTNDGANTSRIDLRVDNKNSVRIEDNHVAFYNEAGTSKRLYWDATNLGLGVNVASVGAGLALHVAGNTQTTDLVATAGITADTVTVQTSLTGSANLAVVSNTDFSSNVTMADDLTVSGTLSITDLDYTLVPDDYDNLIPNQVSGRLLGNTSNRWEGYFTDLDVSNDLDVGGNVTVTDTITTDTLVVTNSAALPSAISFTGVTDFEDINVTGVASFANLQVQSLTTNTAGIIGTGSSVSTTSPTKIDEFDKTVSKGFKYIIHGENSNSNSAYAIEINCSHNGNNVFFTRFGEVSNNFDATIVPQINGGNVELIATCNSASGGNTHLFNMVRIETR